MCSRAAALRLSCNNERVLYAAGERWEGSQAVLSRALTGASLHIEED